MGLRNQSLSAAARFRSEALKVKTQIISAVDRPARLLFPKISRLLGRGDWQDKWTDGIKVGEITG
jgi:hypothetical protein